MAEIDTNIIKNDNDVFIFFSDEAEGIQLTIPDFKFEKAK
jgi:hypothetical protein